MVEVRLASFLERKVREIVIVGVEREDRAAKSVSDFLRDAGLARAGWAGDAEDVGASCQVPGSSFQ